MRTIASFGDEGFVRLGLPAINCHPFASAQLVSSSLSMPVLSVGNYVVTSSVPPGNRTATPTVSANQTLSEGFFEQLKKHPVPLEEPAIKALANISSARGTGGHRGVQIAAA